MIHGFLSCCCIHITLSNIRADRLILRKLCVFKVAGPVSCILEDLQNSLMGSPNSDSLRSCEDGYEDAVTPEHTALQNEKKDTTSLILTSLQILEQIFE